MNFLGLFRLKKSQEEQTLFTLGADFDKENRIYTQLIQNYDLKLNDVKQFQSNWKVSKEGISRDRLDKIKRLNATLIRDFEILTGDINKDKDVTKNYFNRLAQRFFTEQLFMEGLSGGIVDFNLIQEHILKINELSNKILKLLKEQNVYLDENSDWNTYRDLDSHGKFHELLTDELSKEREIRKSVLFVLTYFRDLVNNLPKELRETKKVNDLERKKLGYELDLEHAYFLNDLIMFLRSEKFDLKCSYFEFLIKGEVTPDSIRALLTLPYEVALTEKNGWIILTTGLEDRCGGEKDYMNRSRNSKLSFHTHRLGDKVPVVTPSFSDVYLIEREDQLFSLAHPKGILIYGCPNNFNGDIRGHLAGYAEKKFVALFAFQTGRPFFGMTKTEQIDIQRQFCLDKGIIRDEASWDDKQGVKRVMKKIFGGFNQ